MRPVRCDLPCVPQGARSDRHSRSILPAALVLLGEAYPANHVPGVEVAGELALVLVARHQHDDAPVVYVLKVDGGRGTQIAREGLRGLDRPLLPDPSLRDLPFRLRCAGPLPIHHGFLLLWHSSGKFRIPLPNGPKFPPPEEHRPIVVMCDTILLVSSCTSSRR